MRNEVDSLKIRVEGYIPTRSFTTRKVHSDHDLYYIFDDLRYGPIHEEGELSREDMVKEFQTLFPKFHDDDCQIIKVGDERKID